MGKEKEDTKRLKNDVLDRYCILLPTPVHGDHKALDGNEKELGKGEDGTAGRFISVGKDGAFTKVLLIYNISRLI